MASNVVYKYQHVTEQIIIYLGVFILLSGVIGNILNLIIFLSLKTFRETSCAFYLTVASFANIIHLLASLFSRILITGYNIDLTQTSLVLCKLRQYVAVIAPLMAISSMCFATIDQFLSLTDRWRHLSQKPIACRLVFVTFVFWCLCNIPVIYYNEIVITYSGTPPCSIINPQFSSYYSRFYVSYLLGFFQIIIRISFGLLAFINVRRLAYRHVPIVRLERDKQITKMVLSEVVVDVCLSLPFFVYYTYTSYVSLETPSELSLYALLIYLTSMMNYCTFAVGFYIYVCSSSRFRKQLIYVLVGIFVKHCCHVKIAVNRNQIAPKSSLRKSVTVIPDAAASQEQA